MICEHARIQVKSARGPHEYHYLIARMSVQSTFQNKNYVNRHRIHFKTRFMMSICNNLYLIPLDFVMDSKRPRIPNSRIGQSANMAGWDRVLPWFLCALLPLYVSGGLHFPVWLAQIVAEKGVDQFETDYRWTEISGGGGMS